MSLDIPFHSEVVPGLLGGRTYESGILTYPQTEWNYRCGKAVVETERAQSTPAYDL